MIDAIFRRLIPGRHGKLRNLVALVLAFAIVAFIFLAHGFIAAGLWDHWHPVAGIIWLLFGSGMATFGARLGREREGRRSVKEMRDAADVLLSEAAALRARGGDRAGR